MTRKEAKSILKSLKVDNKFSLKTINFQDLLRKNVQFLIIKNWTPCPKAKEIKEAFADKDVVVEFH